MKRARSLGSVTFTGNALFIQEEFTNGEMIGEMIMSAAGTHIAYSAEIHTPYITLDTQEHGRITDTQKEAIEALWKDPETTLTLTYTDATTDTVRVANEKQLIFVETWEGSCEYTAVIPTAKVL